MGRTGGDPTVAILLAAGRGERLGDLTSKVPKCLLHVGGQALIEHALAQLRQRGIARAVIVVGYRGQQVREHLRDRVSDHALTFMTNSDYNRTGSMGSLACGVRAVLALGRGPAAAVVMDTDLLFHPDHLAAALSAEGCGTVVTEPSGTGDEAFVCCNSAGQIQSIAKDPPPERRSASAGEMMGLTRLTLAGLEAYLEHHARRPVDDAAPHYEEVLLDMARVGLPFRAVSCYGRPWAEVDTASDLSRARDVVWPALRSLWSASGW